MGANSPLIIGLGHASRQGKDTFADAFCSYADEHYPDLSVARHSIAWELKRFCYELFRHQGMRPASYYEGRAGDELRKKRLPLLGNRTPVDVWCYVGQTLRAFHASVWIDRLFDHMDRGADITVITDIRFDNEIKEIRGRGGEVWKISRPELPPLPTEADQALLYFDGWDYTCETNDIDELRIAACGCAESVCDRLTRQRREDAKDN